MLTTEYCDIQLVTDAKQPGGGAAGVLNGAKVIFGVNNISPSKTTVVADITQSVDADLAPQTVTWGAAFRDGDGDIVTISDLIAIKIANNANATVIKSWGLTDSAGANLLMSEDLGMGFSLPDTLALWNMLIPFAPGNPQGKEAVITS